MHYSMLSIFRYAWIFFKLLTFEYSFKYYQDLSQYNIRILNNIFLENYLPPSMS